MSGETLRAQTEIAELIEARGYRQPWSDDQFAVRNVAKLVEEVSELAKCIQMPVVPISFWLMSLEDAGKYARNDFDTTLDIWRGAYVDNIEHAKKELADVMVVVCNIADAISRSTGEEFDVMAAALEKARADVDRGVR